MQIRSLNACFFLLTVFFTQNILSQQNTLWHSYSYQKALKNSTRSLDGNPGPNYWQNHAAYDMTVSLDTLNGTINGHSDITYYNYSRDSIRDVVFRIYPNKRAKGEVRNSVVNPEDIIDFISMDKLTYNGETMAFRKSIIHTNGTNLKIQLPSPIPPDMAVEFQCEWTYPLPVGEGFRRTGYHPDNAWFVGYFYPQIAVYDDMEVGGWDYYLSHLGEQEFYNDFNTYDVTIKVPEGYYVWATGDQVNEQDVFTESILDKLKQLRNSTDTVNILASNADRKAGLKSNIWKFHAKEVPDFAFATSRMYNWEAAMVQVGDKKVEVSAVYREDAKLFDKVLEYACKSLTYANDIGPRIPYPYSKAVVVNTGVYGGMEFPMLANDVASRDTLFTATLTYHELCHNFFPFMMGFNEKRYAFMDEGLTQFYSDKFGQYLLHTDMYEKRSTKNIFGMYEQFMKVLDYPLLHAYSAYNEQNSFYLNYIKPNVAFKYFEEMVGEEAFNSALQVFVENWQGRHPTPWDLFYTFNTVLGENFNWFWNDWFFSAGYPDLELSLKGTFLKVERLGKDALPVPVHLRMVYKDNVVTEILETAEVWKDGKTHHTLKLKDFAKLKSVEVVPYSIPDTDWSNNFIHIQHQ